MITLYNAVSADGFIARRNCEEDFIPDDAFDEFLELLKEYGVYVMGRKTYETIMGYPQDMVRNFEKSKIRRVIITHNKNFHPGKGYEVIHSLSEINNFGSNILVSSGPNLNDALIEAGVVDRVMWNVVPEKINEGIPVFRSRVVLSQLSSSTLHSGRKLNTYTVRA